MKIVNNILVQKDNIEKIINEILSPLIKNKVIIEELEGQFEEHFHKLESYKIFSTAECEEEIITDTYEDRILLGVPNVVGYSIPVQASVLIPDNDNWLIIEKTKSLIVIKKAA